MRQIGTLPDHDQARRLADFLLTQKITTRLDQTPKGCVVWVHDEDKVGTATMLLQEFQQDPGHARYDEAAALATSLRRRAERIQREHERQSVYLRDHWLYRSPRRVPVTIALIALSVAVFCLQNFDPGRGNQVKSRLRIAATGGYVLDDDGTPRWPRELLSENLADLSEVRQGQVWRLVTPIFMHFGIIHLVFNMFWLADLGAQYEMLRKRWRLALFVAGTAAVSNVAQYLWDGPGFGGMSGVVYALFGYTWMKTHFEPNTVFRLSSGATPVMLVWLLVCMTGVIGPIANAAHLVGLLAGVVVGVAPHARDIARSW